MKTPDLDKLLALYPKSPEVKQFVDAFRNMAGENARLSEALADSILDQEAIGLEDLELEHDNTISLEVLRDIEDMDDTELDNRFW